jgi:hypothetical protein
MAKPRGKPFQKGNKAALGNKRPKAPEIQQLREAIAKVELEKDCSLLEHFVRQAFKDNKVMIALGKKIIPDLSAVDGKQTVKVDIGAPTVIFGTKKGDKDE